MRTDKDVKCSNLPAVVSRSKLQWVVAISMWVIIRCSHTLTPLCRVSLTYSSMLNQVAAQRGQCGTEHWPKTGKSCVYGSFGFNLTICQYEMKRMKLLISCGFILLSLNRDNRCMEATWSSLSGSGVRFRLLQFSPQHTERSDKCVHAAALYLNM